MKETLTLRAFFLKLKRRQSICILNICYKNMIFQKKPLDKIKNNTSMPLLIEDLEIKTEMIRKPSVL